MRAGAAAWQARKERALVVAAPRAAPCRPLPSPRAGPDPRRRRASRSQAGKMATLGGESQPFPAGLAAAVALHPQHHGGAGSLGCNLPLSRALERALEEAAHSGGLSLSARKLKEFPRGAPGHDLSDTVRADLSKNRLTEVPMELCHFVSLETLNLYHNCVKIIPDAIVNLQMLTYLNLSRNQLSSLPACLCGLPLKVLIASNNKLGSLPEEIGQLKQLMELDVSCNEITSLPKQIGQLKSLRELNIRRNYLKVLPQELVELPLVKFDFSCNKVLVIPICFRKMAQLQVLLLENNPLQSPPAQICIKGKVHIFKYLNIQACQIKTADSLYLDAIEQPHLQQPVEENIDDIYPSKKDSDSGVGSDNGDKRLSATEPSDEDTISLNVPMSNIMEEDQVIKEDSGHRRNLVQEFHQGPSDMIPNDKSRESGNEFAEGSHPLSTEFMNYIKGREAKCDELLRIEEDIHWQTEGILSADITEDTGVNLYPVEPSTDLELQESTVNGQMQMEEFPVYQNENAEEELEFQKRRDLIIEKTKTQAKIAHEQDEKQLLSQNDLFVWNVGGCSSHDESEEKTLTQSPATNNAAPFGLKPRSVFLRPQRNLESIDPQFTIRRKMEQMREERELLEQLRENIEMRLKICLPEDLGSALMDGVVLCHLVNNIRPRSVGSIHVPSPAVPKLSMAKCRRNVENFLDACRKLGIAEADLCSPYDILQSDIRHIRKTVDSLLALGEKTPQSTSSAFRSWDLIGFCVFHILFIVLMYITYHWNALTA